MVLHLCGFAVDRYSSLAGREEGDVSPDERDVKWCDANILEYLSVDIQHLKCSSGVGTAAATTYLKADLRGECRANEQLSKKPKNSHAKEDEQEDGRRMSVLWRR